MRADYLLWVCGWFWCPRVRGESNAIYIRQRKPISTGNFRFAERLRATTSYLVGDQVEQGAWEDPDFLKPFEGNGEKVTVEEGETKSVKVTTIKTASTQEQKP